MKKIFEWVKAKLNIRFVVRRKLQNTWQLFMQLLRNVNYFIYPFIETDAILKPIYVNVYKYKHEHGCASITRVYILGLRVYERKIENEQ